MLKAINRTGEIFIDNARAFNQLTFGSLILRGYIEFNRDTQNFYITHVGSSALQEFKEIEIRRIKYDGPFSHYFPETNIRNKQKPKDNVRQMRKAS